MWTISISLYATYTHVERENDDDDDNDGRTGQQKHNLKTSNKQTKIQSKGRKAKE